MKIAILVAFVALCAAASSGCHNVTGTCLSHGFVCANEQVVPHAKRCNGAEDCADGTDEFMCDSALREVADKPEHHSLIEQTSCARCTCAIGMVSFLVTTHVWWRFAIAAPMTRTFMSSGSLRLPCHVTRTTGIVIEFYKKDMICRGWQCCARQQQCVSCSTGSPADNNRCWS